MEQGEYAPLMRLCHGLSEATAAGRIDWVAGEETSFLYHGSKGAVEIRSRHQDGEPPYELILYNPKMEKVDTLLSEGSVDEAPAPWNDPVFELYRAVRRRALGVDELIEDLLAEVRANYASRG